MPEKSKRRQSVASQEHTETVNVDFVFDTATLTDTQGIYGLLRQLFGPDGHASAGLDLLGLSRELGDNKEQERTTVVKIDFGDAMDDDEENENEKKNGEDKDDDDEDDEEEDGDSGVCAFLGVTELNDKAGKATLTLSKYLEEQLQTEKDILSALSAPKTAFVLYDRLVNVPPHVLRPLLEIADRDVLAPNSIENVLLVSRSYKDDQSGDSASSEHTAPSKRRHTDPDMVYHPEDTVLAQFAQSRSVFEYRTPVPDTNTDLVPSTGTLFLIKRDKLSDVLAALDSAIHS